jgi:hypothetical protein
MVRAYRKLTGAVLLASYLAATIGAWSHGRHDCRDDAQVSPASERYACHDHSQVASVDPALHGVCGHSAQHAGDAQVAWSSRYESHSHHFDQCLICQFLAIQKVLDLSEGSTPSAAVLAQRLVYPDHRLLVAERFGTPDSRGPPRTC